MGLLWSLRFPDPIMLLMMGMRSLESFVIPVLIADHVASELHVANFSSLERVPCVANDTLNEEQVQAESARWTMAYGLASSLPGAVTAIMIGGWSDRIGRRIPILLSVGGYALSAATALAVAHWNLSLAILIAAVSIQGVLGSYPTVLLSVYAYTSDISHPAKRTSRLLILSAIEYVGSGSLQVLAGFMLKSHGVFWTECIVLGGHLLNMSYAGFLLADSRDVSHKMEAGDTVSTAEYPSVQASGTLEGIPANHAEKKASSFLFSVKKTFALILKPWPKRRQFIFLLIIFGLLVISFIGPNGLIVLYAMGHPHCWESTMTGYFISARFAALILSILAITPLIGILKIPDRHIVQVSILGLAGYFAVIGIAENTTAMFIAPCCMIIMGPCVGTLRAMLSKLVAPTDHGAMFALVASFEMALSVVSSLVYNNLYSYLIKNVTIPVLPNSGSLCFLIASGVCMVPILLMCFLPRTSAAEDQESDGGERKPLLAK